MLKDLTAFVLTYNSERRLSECLDSLSFCNKLIVIDSISTDRTKEIALSYPNVEFIENPFVNFIEQHNFALSHIKTKWAIFLDSDEFFTKDAQKEVQDFFNNKLCDKYSGAYIPRSSYFFGKFLKHSDFYPDYTLRLFKVENTRLVNCACHQEYKSNSDTIKLQSNIIHYPYTSFEHYMQKLSLYAELGAKDKTEQGKKFSLTSAILHALWGFIRIYIYKKGFLDGKAGFIVASHHAFYVYLKYVRIGENAETFGLNHKYCEKK